MPQFFSQIQILKYSLFTGDGRLISASVDLGEDERASTCSFTFYDPGLKIASYLFQLSQSSGGITTHQGLLEAPESGTTPSPTPAPVPAPSPAPGPSPSPVPPSGTNPPGTAGKTSTGIYLSNAPNGLKNDALAKKIIEYCYAMQVNDIHHIAYILATCQHESVMGVYSEEIASGSAYEGRADLGNTQPGDGVRFKGRGYVQITGRNNYNKFGRWLGEDFLTEPRNKLLAEAKFAIPTLVCGMTGTQGSPNFTGKVLKDYGRGSSFDATNARRTVNGTDRASTIAGYYRTWLTKIPNLVPASPTSLYLAEQAVIPSLTLTSISSPLTASELLDSAYLALDVAEAPMGRDGRPAMPTYGSVTEPTALAEWIAANFAFLDVIALAVGTYNRGVDAFKVIEGQTALMDSTKAHPGGGKRAGKFFVTESQWQKAKAANTAIKDFGQDGQVATAIQVLKDLGSYLDDLKAAQYSKIFGYAKQAWPELPGGTKQKLTQTESDTFFRRRITEIQQATDSGGTPTPRPTPTPGPTPTPSPTPAPVPGLPPVSGGGNSPGSPQFTGNGTPITIAIGSWDSATATLFNFSYTSIDVEHSGLPTVTIAGRSVKWNTTQGRQLGKTYQEASLFDVATAITAEAGVQLQIEGDIDPVVPYAVQPATGDNRSFLASLAKEYGYRLREYNSVVTLSPQASAYDTKFIVTYGMTSKLTFGDAADSQRILLRDSFSDVGAKQQPPTIDLATGRIEYPRTIESVLPSATKPPNGVQIGRGYESTVDLQLSEQTLALKPGDLIWLDYSLAPNPFARDWRVNRVVHEISESGSTTTLKIYLPVYIQTTGQSGTTPSPTPSPGTPSPTPGQTPSPIPTPTPGPVPGQQKLTPQQIFDQYADAVIWINGEGIGTGFIVTTEGHFMSCNHVVSNANGKIKLKDGTDMTYTLVGTNSSKDMTVGKLNNYTKGKVCWLAKTADSDAPNGSTVTAIGHPLDKRWTLTSAPRTGTSQCLSYRGNNTLDCIKTGPNLVDRGNSGGPIFSNKGLVVGMAESQSSNADGATKIEHLRAYFLEVVGKAIPDPAPIIATPVPAPVPNPPAPIPPAVPATPVPPASTPPQGSVTSEAQLETLTSLRMINPEPGTRTTSAFGWRNHPVTGGRKLHRGTDCAKGKGTKILAAAAGKVIKIGGVSGYGDYNVVVYHGKVNGVPIHGMYAHGSNLQVEVGQFVRQGDWIVSEDTLGMSTGSHLHFGITIGWAWSGAAYPPNSPNVWYDPVKNFITNTFTGSINSDGVLDNGTRGGNMPT